MHVLLIIIALVIAVFILSRLPLRTMWHIIIHGEYLVHNVVEIDKSPQVVFDVVTRSKLWPAYYPETVAVSGVTKRPFVPGDVRLYSNQTTLS